MPLRLAINGYGRIGRSVLRALYESPHLEAMRIVTINEPADLNSIAHLTKYDTTHGRFAGEVAVAEGGLNINDDFIAVSHETDPGQLDWRGQDIDVVLECSGVWDERGDLEKHLEAGADRVLLSQPGAFDMPAIVYGVNHQQLDGDTRIATNASCTTNGIVPVIEVLHRAFGIVSGTITTIHSAMNDQPVLDAYHHKDLRKTRAAGQSVIPVRTELAAGVGRILPELDGRFVARALRVPTHNVSAMQLTVQLEKDTDTEAVNRALAEAAESGPLAGLLGYTEEPLASCDFNHDAHSSVVDAGQSRVTGQLATVLVWFDNEWGYANRMLDVVAHWTGQSGPGKQH
ncbi:MAG: type I glyceraldehyde-3-phosphate dehydrogenase [Pseudomonadota bacterium]